MDFYEYKNAVVDGIRKKIGECQGIEINTIKDCYSRNVPVDECVDATIDEMYYWNHNPGGV